MQLEGRTALVTGAAVGTGRAIAHALARAGCHVAVNYAHSAAEAEETVRSLTALGVRAIAVRADVGRDEAVRAMVRRTVEAFGRLDVVVNNAGTTVFVPHQDLEGLSDAAWMDVLRVNLLGPFHVIRAALPALREARGAVVNISSIAGTSALGSSLAYCASKAALNNLTVALARALAPEVRVNAVAPGFIAETRWWASRPGYAAIRDAVTDRTPLKRVCRPEDVAEGVLGLLRADLVTGQVLVVDGGATLGP